MLSGQATGIPESAAGHLEMIGALRVARRSAVRTKIFEMNQLHAMVVLDLAQDELAPDEVCEASAG